MDRWKRGEHGTLLNDDSTGYENARKRVASKTKRKEELEALSERVTVLERKIYVMNRTIESLVELCKALTDAVKKG